LQVVQELQPVVVAPAARAGAGEIADVLLQVRPALAATGAAAASARGCRARGPARAPVGRSLCRAGARRAALAASFRRRRTGRAGGAGCALRLVLTGAAGTLAGRCLL